MTWHYAGIVQIEFLILSDKVYYFKALIPKILFKRDIY